jgi:hypothetical protein
VALVLNKHVEANTEEEARGIAEEALGEGDWDDEWSWDNFVLLDGNDTEINSIEPIKDVP